MNPYVLPVLCVCLLFFFWSCQLPSRVCHVVSVFASLRCPHLGLLNHGPISYVGPWLNSVQFDASRARQESPSFTSFIIQNIYIHTYTHRIYIYSVNAIF